MAKVTEYEPYFIELFGNCIINNEENKKYSNEKDKRIISKIECNYKTKNLSNNKNEEKKEIGIFIIGKNLILEDNDDLRQQKTTYFLLLSDIENQIQGLISEFTILMNRFSPEEINSQIVSLTKLRN